MEKFQSSIYSYGLVKYSKFFLNFYHHQIFEIPFEITIKKSFHRILIVYSYLAMNCDTSFYFGSPLFYLKYNYWLTGKYISLFL